MKRQEICALIRETGLFPAIRVSAADVAIFAAESVFEAGIPIVEITMTVPGAIDVIAKLTRAFPSMVVGAGTVLDSETAGRCIDAGAGFLTSPGFIPEVTTFASREDIAMIPGALTPSEVIAAWKAGVDFVKIFPCAPVGGDKYIRALKVPLPQVSLIASGGVSLLSAADYFLAGASAIGIGAELMPKEALRLRNAEWIHELGRRFTAIVLESRHLNHER